jgi:alpha-beta hydrolase superfamily lysophospholipase
VSVPLLRLLVLLWFAGIALVQGDVTARPGSPRPGVVEETFSLTLDGSPEAVDIYRPATGVPRAVVILAHGFTRSRLNLAELGRDLAASGFTAVVPNLPYLVDHTGNGRVLGLLASMIENAAAPELDLGSRRVIFAGFSAGGLASLLAAASHPGALGWIGLDPVDRGDRGIVAAPGLRTPAYVFRAPSAACNAYANSEAIVKRLPAVAEERVVANASHCDFEAPTDGFCEFICGRADPARQAAIRAWVVEAAKVLAAR